MSAKEMNEMRLRAGGKWDAGALETTVTTASDDAEERRRRETARRERMRVADAARAARRARAEDADAEADGPRRTLREDEDDAARRAAAAKLEDDLPGVREMNSMVLFGKVMMTRDAQIEEKRVARLKADEERRRLDESMERERVDAVKRAEIREIERSKEMRRGAETIREQIAERERDRANEVAELEREALKRKEDVERAIASDIAEKQRKRKDVIKLFEQIDAENREQIKRKAEVERAEREADERAMEYLRLKDERDAAKAAEEEAQRRERELETARLRSLQEKYIDGRAERDLMRARKLQDDHERAMRAKEATERDKRRQMLLDLSAARVAQHEDKVRTREREKELERIDAERVRREHAVQVEAERQRDAERRAANVAHKLHVIGQIEANDEAKRRTKLSAVADAAEERARDRRERDALEMIRARKIKELENARVPAKYVVELKSKKTTCA